MCYLVLSNWFQWRSGSGCPAAATRKQEASADQRRAPAAVPQVLPVLAGLHCRGSVTAPGSAASSSPPGSWRISYLNSPTVALQELPATWTLTAWCGCSTAPWETPGRRCATPETRAKVNRTTTGWSASTKTRSSSGDCWFFSLVAFFFLKILVEKGARHSKGPQKWNLRTLQFMLHFCCMNSGITVKVPALVYYYLCL